MPSPPGTLRRAWFYWKSLKLPWRRKWLCGSDLAGNTFWEFKDHVNANRLRRIVHYNPRTHYADVKITPQWIQWLRHTRPDPPTISEQQLDEIRQARIKQLAAAADARWASKPSVLDRPEMQQPPPAIAPRDPAGHAGQTEPEEVEGVRNAVGTPGEVRENVEGKETDKGRFRGETREPPWKGVGGTTEERQPDAWRPKVVRRR